MKKYLIFCLSLICFFLVPLESRAQEKLQIAIKGVNEELLQNIQVRLKVEEKKLNPQPNGAEIRFFFRKAHTEIKEAIAPYGYFNSHIESSLLKTKAGWLASYNIQLGRPVRIKTVDLQLSGEGAADPKLQAYLKKNPLQPGDIFTSKTYETVKDNLYQLANEQGYIKANFDELKVLIHRAQFSANIIIHFNTQARYYFGSWDFNKTSYDPAFLEKFIIFNSSQPFSSEKLSQYQQDMNETRYFKQVLVLPQLEKIENYHVPIHVSVVPPKARSYMLGIGYGSFTGPRATAGIHFNRLTASGQSADIQFKLSSVLSGFAAKYYIPGKHPLSDQWFLSLDHKKFKPKNGDSFSRAASIGYQYKRKPWSVISNINYLIEKYTVNNDPFSTSELLYPRLAISYIKADDVILPTQGKSFSWAFQAASKQLLSSTSFIQSDIKGKYYFTPFRFGHFILRGEFGYTVVNHLSDLPLSMRFFTGGATTLRGYPDSSVGPGRYLQLASIEYQHYLSKNWLIAFFYDAGIATNNLGTPLNKGDGIGVIYRSAVGPIRLYLATALSKPNHPYQVEFSMGPEF